MISTPEPTQFLPRQGRHTAGPRESTPGLPADLLGQSASRLRAVALLYAFVYFFSGFFPALLFPADRALLFASVRYWAPGATSIGLALLVAAISRSRRAPLPLIMSIGLAFEVVSSYFIASAEFLLDPATTDMLGHWMGLSWVAVWTLLFTVVVPTRPRRALLAALASVAAVPLVVGFAMATRSLSSKPDPGQFFFVFVFPYLLVVIMAYVAARVVYALGTEVSRARDLGSYRLVERLGQGGMGEVWRAKHSMLARPAAIKLIRPSLIAGGISAASDEMQRRFEREAQVIARLRSPHTVTLFDFGVAPDGAFYYVMELLEGLDAETLVRRHGPIPADRTIHVLRQMCHSLSEAESCGLVHRDIKPANVFLCKYGEEFDFVKVLDFGIAKAAHDAPDAGMTLTRDLVVRGTPAFIAPEQALGGSGIDGRADIYATGCVAYWLLTGQLVFTADTPTGGSSAIGAGVVAPARGARGLWRLDSRPGSCLVDAARARDASRVGPDQGHGVYRRSIDEVVAALATDAQRGLNTSEAQSRLRQHGRNELLAEKPAPAWRRFLAQFEDVLVILLLVATAISAGLWVYERDAALPYEAIAIFAVVLLNAAMGYTQESRAEAAVAALRAMLGAEATVIRDGARGTVPTTDLVPGDIIIVEEGDAIPADGRLVESVALQTAEAALTGESLPVTKDTEAIAGEVPLGDRHNMVFSGTAATFGHGTAVVTATAMQTEMGRIAGLLKDTPDESTPLQQELDRTGKMLGFVVVVIAVLMIATILIVEDVRGLPAILDVLILGVALAVAAVPEGLPAIVTAVLAIGVQRMARRHAIIRHLAAVETLGSATVIASDKTGTLTRNEMTVRVVVTASGRANFDGSGYGPEGRVRREDGGAIDGALAVELERALAVADRANNARVHERDGRWTVEGDPTEGALLVAARKCGLRSDVLDQRLPRVGEVPFSSERKLMTTLHRDLEQGARGIVFTKGAPDVLLARCSFEVIGDGRRVLTPERRAEILRVNEALAGEALRTLGVAALWVTADVLEQYAADPDVHVERDLVFAGLIGMIDPPRAEAKDAVAQARGAGIRPLMITGDHPRTAAVIAQELGISQDGRAVTGAAFEALPEVERARTVAEVSVYARVNPEHKLRIVESLRRNGAVVAMTGDGVNDAPALKRADIGIAMGITGTDVSKEAADMVLADDNFASIVAAVEEGRAIFANIRKFLRYLLSSNIGEVLTMFFGVLLAKEIGLHAEGGGLVLPLLATQILWINLVTDGLPALALGVDPPDEGLMRQPPRPVGEGVLTPEMWRGIAFVGVIMAAGTLLVLDASLPGGFVEGAGDLRYGQTMGFTTLMLFQMFNVLNARSDRRSAFTHMFTNLWLWTALGVSLLLQAAVIYLPSLQRAFGTASLSARDWVFCVAIASSVLWLREIGKLCRRLLAAAQPAATHG